MCRMGQQMGQSRGSAASRGVQWPLIGRREELAAVEQSLTSVGSGAVVPVRPPATMLTTLEAVFGQFYIAIVVAQLVGARLSQALQRNNSP